MSEQPEVDQRVLARKIRSAFFEVAVSADNGVDWDRLRGLLERAGLPLSAEERCRLLLQAANTGALSVAQWQRLIGVRNVAAPADDEIQARDELVEHIRTALALLAEADTRGDEKTFEMLRRALAARIKHTVLLTPTWSASSWDLPHVLARDMPSAVDYALWTLLSGDHGLRVRRCKLSSCRTFFFVRKGPSGAPSRTYCKDDPEHVEAGERERARNRMRDLRARRSGRS